MPHIPSNLRYSHLYLFVKAPVLKLSTAQIGKSGELLVQYRLLLLGIESAPLSTDTGIDLVAYSPSAFKAVTIQIKTNLKPKPGGGKGRMALDWWIPEKCPADLVAMVDLESERVWLMTMVELNTHAQQRSAGRMHIYMYADPEAKPRGGDYLMHAHEFERFILSNRSSELFSV